MGFMELTHPRLVLLLMYYLQNNIGQQCVNWETLVTLSFDQQECYHFDLVLQVPYARSTSSVNRTPPEASAYNGRPKSPSLMETQQEFTCDLCKVTAMSEIILNAHLQGIKHKSNVESLKASMLFAKDTRPSPLVTCETLSTNGFALVVVFSCDKYFLKIQETSAIFSLRTVEQGYFVIYKEAGGLNIQFL